MHRLRARLNILIVVGCVVVLVMEALATIHAHAPTVDFANGYRAAWSLRRLINPSAAAPAWISSNSASNYFYDPTFILLLLPLTLLPQNDAVLVWYGVITAALALAIYALIRSAGARPTASGVLFLLLAAAVTSEARAEYFLGQVNLVVLCAICVALWQRQEGRPGVGGLILALACVIKPMYLLVPVFLLWKREFRFGGVALTAFLVLLLAPFVWLGGRAFRALVAAWSLFSGPLLSFIDNVSPRGMLDRLFAPNLYLPPLVNAPALATVFWLLLSVAVALLTLAVVAPKPLERHPASVLDVGLMVCTALLISPLTETGYLNLLLISLVALWLLLPTVDWRAPPFRYAAVGLLLLWLLDTIPAKYFTHPITAHFAGHALFIDPAVIYTGSRFAFLVGVFAVDLFALSVERAVPLRVGFAQLTLSSPTHIRQWLGDAGAAWKDRPQWLFRT